MGLSHSRRFFTLVVRILHAATLSHKKNDDVMIRFVSVAINELWLNPTSIKVQKSDVLDIQS